MAHIVILGAGIGGIPMAYEMGRRPRKEDKVTVVSDPPRLPVRPVQPLGGGQLAHPRDIKVEWRRCARKDIDHHLQPAKRVHPEQSRSNWRTAARGLRLPGHRHRPQAGLRRSGRPGPQGPHSRSATWTTPRRPRNWDDFVERSRPHRRRRGAGRLLLRPGLRIRHDHGHRPAQPQDPRQGADDLRHLRALHRPSGPGRSGRLQGPAGMRPCATRHIKWICNAKVTKVEAGKMFVTEHGRQRANRRRSTNCRSSTP